MAVPYVTSKQYTESFGRAMSYWKKWHKEYIFLIPEYRRLMKEKQEKHIEPLRTISKTVLSDFPKIYFLDIQNWDIAEEYLLELTYGELLVLIEQLENYEFNHARRRLKVWIADTKRALNPKLRSKTYYGGYDPGYSKTVNPVPKVRHRYSIHDE